MNELAGPAFLFGQLHEDHTNGEQHKPKISRRNKLQLRVVVKWKVIQWHSCIKNLVKAMPSSLPLKFVTISIDTVQQQVHMFELVLNIVLVIIVATILDHVNVYNVHFRHYQDIFSRRIE